MSLCWTRTELTGPKTGGSSLTGQLFGGRSFGRSAWRSNIWTAKINGRPKNKKKKNPTTNNQQLQTTKKYERPKKYLISSINMSGINRDLIGQIKFEFVYKSKLRILPIFEFILCAVAEAEYFELKPAVGAEIEVGYLNHLKHNALITGIVESELE
ncbi:hypothetical protein BpHYR1_020309 [Brachionus plicatilis]|uniref:Uncharacterized protein n=1 Tax=Brachionus plicatilis TaxID=10195 RepID=A0A3M7RCI6_BRAPC|nr:hypothetical protein BpHYR1_020309 [Brachionus plicatilis]